MVVLKLALAIVCAPGLLAAWSIGYDCGCWALAALALAACVLFMYASDLKQARKDAIANAYF